MPDDVVVLNFHDGYDHGREDGNVP
jgi:hypothetical protein